MRIMLLSPQKCLVEFLCWCCCFFCFLWEVYFTLQAWTFHLPRKSRRFTNFIGQAWSPHCRVPYKVLVLSFLRSAVRNPTYAANRGAVSRKVTIKFKEPYLLVSSLWFSRRQLLNQSSCGLYITLIRFSVTIYASLLCLFGGFAWFCLFVLLVGTKCINLRAQ